jgi:hypothetical protein
MLEVPANSPSSCPNIPQHKMQICLSWKKVNCLLFLPSSSARIFYGVLQQEAEYEYDYIKMTISYKVQLFEMLKQGSCSFCRTCYVFILGVIQYTFKKKNYVLSAGQDIHFLQYVQWNCAHRRENCFLLSKYIRNRYFISLPFLKFVDAFNCYK